MALRSEQLPAHRNALPGLRPLADDTARSGLAQAWGSDIPPAAGTDFTGILDLCAAGRMGALLIVGSDPVLTYPDRAFAEQALAAAGLLVVQDTFLTDTAGLAEVVLPAAGYGEESGTFTSNEGRLQKVRKFREPAFEARGNLAIFDFIAGLRDQALRPSQSVDIFAEVARLVPAYAALTHEGLGADGAFTQSPPPPPADEILAILPGPEASEGLLLITGNGLFHNGYHSERSQILNSIAPDPFVEMSAADAARRGLADRDQVVVRSAHGALTAELRINRRFPAGLVFVPENYRALRLNSLMRRGEYPVPVEADKAPAALPSARLAEAADGPAQR